MPNRISGVPKAPYSHLTDPNHDLPPALPKSTIEDLERWTKGRCAALYAAHARLKRDGNHILALQELETTLEFLEDYRDKPYDVTKKPQYKAFYIDMLSEDQIKSIRKAALCLLALLCTFTAAPYRRLRHVHQRATDLLETYRYLTDIRGMHPRYGQIPQPCWDRYSVMKRSQTHKPATGQTESATSRSQSGFDQNAQTNPSYSDLTANQALELRMRTAAKVRTIIQLCKTVRKTIDDEELRQAVRTFALIKRKLDTSKSRLAYQMTQEERASLSDAVLGVTKELLSALARNGRKNEAQQVQSYSDMITSVLSETSADKYWLNAMLARYPRSSTVSRPGTDVVCLRHRGSRRDTRSID